MNVAFLIQAHNNPGMLLRFVKRLIGHGDIFIHIDAKADIAPFAELAAFAALLENRVIVRWAGASQIEALMRLFGAAMERRAYDYYSFHSGSDYPVRPLERFRQFLAEHAGEEFLDRTPMRPETLSRVERLHLTDFYNPKERGPDALLCHAIEAELALLPPRPMPHGWKPYTGSQWFTVTHALAGAAHAAWTGDAELRAFTKFSYCPDEWFMPTFAMANGFGDRISAANNLRHIDWSGKRNRGKPALLMKDDYFDIIRSGAFFARKINGTDPELLDLLDYHALKRMRA